MPPDLGPASAAGHHCGVYWHERYRQLKASIASQLPVLKRFHLWLLSLLYLATFGSFIGFSAGFAMLSKTQFPDVNILHLAFFGP